MFVLFDQAAFTAINGSMRCPFLDAVLPLFSDSWLIWVALAAFFTGYGVWCRRRHGKALSRLVALAIFFALSVGATDGICNIIKDEIGRHRPFQTVNGAYFFTTDRTWTVIKDPSFSPGSRGGSFPSSHAANSMALAAGAALFFPRCRPWIFAIPFLVGWSRVYVGKHFPLDVAAGWLIGVFVAAVVWRLSRRILAFAERRRSEEKGTAR